MRPSRGLPSHCDQLLLGNDHSDNSSNFQRYLFRRSDDITIHFSDGLLFTRLLTLLLQHIICVGESSCSLAPSATQCHSGLDMGSTNACQDTSEKQFGKPESSASPLQRNTHMTKGSSSVYLPQRGATAE